MQANPEKFQSIIFKRNNVPCAESFHVCNTDVVHNDTVKLLDVYIDNTLTFSNHISEICKQAGRHLNVIRRISQTLGINGKLALYHSFITF